MSDLFDELDDLAAVIESTLDISDVTYIDYEQIETAIEALNDSIDLIEQETGLSLDSAAKQSSLATNALVDSRAESVYYLNKGYIALLDKTERMEAYPDIYNVYN